MYLSRIKLNTTRSATMKALVSPNLLHGAIEHCACDSTTRKLWRIDTLKNEKYLLILTEKMFDFSGVARQFGYDDFDAKMHTRNYAPLLERITVGSQWQFRLKANPTIKKNGKVLAHITTEFQSEWFKKQAEKHGFSLNDEWLVTGSQWYVFRKGENRNKVRMLAVTYEGILTVTDAEAFKNALVNGIGREKAYGLGLLTIAGVRK